MSRPARRIPLLAAMLTGTSLAGASIPLHAASAPSPPQTTAAIPLDQAAIGFGAIVQAHAQLLRPAPLPDPDVSAPELSSEALAGQADPSVAPGLFNPQTHFAGDGYAAGSSIEGDQNHRHSTGGGISLSIPME